MDSSGTSDPFCKIKIGHQMLKTRVKYKSLTPDWNELLILYVYQTPNPHPFPLPLPKRGSILLNQIVFLRSPSTLVPCFCAYLLGSQLFSPSSSVPDYTATSPPGSIRGPASYLHALLALYQDCFFLLPLVKLITSYLEVLVLPKSTFTRWFLLPSSLVC